jgi:hypothetical protein
MTKLKTPEQKDHETDLRMKRKYGRGLDWYNAQLSDQGGGCAVCGDGPGTRRLNIDHDHKWKYVKIVASKIGKWWSAAATYCGKQFSCFPASGKRADAVSGVKESLKTSSVRGLLCHRCNRAAILLRDSPVLLRKMASYIEKFDNKNGVAF